MNIFASYPNPSTAAKYLDSKRVIKLVLESAQILSTVLQAHYGVKNPTLYRSSHFHHPVVLWAAKTQGNFIWLIKHYAALLKEYHARYPGKTHACSLRLPPETFEQYSHVLPNKRRTKFQNSARDPSRGLDYTHYTDVCRAYRLYLKAKWRTDKRAPTW